MCQQGKMTDIRPLSRLQIDKVFADAETQGDYLIGLYREVYPNWDEIAKIDGWPRISDQTNEYIFGKAIAFDKVHHPDVLSGGAWLNNGFSSISEDVPDWIVEPATVKLKEIHD